MDMQMNPERKTAKKILLLVLLIAALSVGSSRLHADTGTCGGSTVSLPFTDVGGSVFFCQIAEAYFSGLANGTSATTYSPTANVTREQMAAFITRTEDQALKRGSRRAALDQFWNTTPHYDAGLGIVPNTTGFFVKSDGADLWASASPDDVVYRVRASDGKLLETWTGMTSPQGVLIAMGRVFVCGFTRPGTLYMIDPSQPAGAVTTVSTSLGDSPVALAFDGNRIWSTNFGIGQRTGTVSIITPQSGTNWPATTVGGFNNLQGIVYDGANMWVTDLSGATLDKLDSSGNILQTVLMPVPEFPAFDGTNIWVPNGVADSVTVVRASTGAIVAILRGNGLGGAFYAAFDGQRILVTDNSSQSVSLWRATDLTPLGSFSTGSAPPIGACSDGINFWIQTASHGLARF